MAHTVETDDDRVSFGDATMLAGEAIAGLNEEWQTAGFAARVTYEVRLNAQDQPMIAFVLLLDLEDDFDVADWPADEVTELHRRVNDRIIGSSIDEWDWLVTARARASTG